MKKGIGIHKKKHITRPIIYLLIILILVVLFLFYKENIKNYLIPIYEIEDRTGNVKKAQEKYKNEKVVGWLRIQGTNIDYPIVRNYKIEAPAERNFDYTWTNSTVNKPTDYLAIFGHNLRNVSKHPIIGDKNMNQFEQLMSYIYYDFNKDNKYIQYTVGGKNYLYQIFSVAMVPGYKINYYDTSYNSKKEKQTKIKESIADSYFDYDVEVTTDDKIISLITCTRFNGMNSDNFKIDAKLVENKEKGYNYSVREKENYKEIKKILEGDGDDV